MYTEHFSTKQTPQSQAVPGKTQVKNNAGGFVFEVDPWQVLKRFLILGTEGGSYYCSEKAMTVQNAEKVVALIKEDGLRVLTELLNVSTQNRAIKNDPAIFTLALVCTFAKQDVKNQAYHLIKQVCRTGTQLFSFCQFIQDLRGWSAGLRKGVSAFYEDRTPEELAYQVVKYRQRNGWTHADVLNLAHPKKRKGLDNQWAKVFQWVVGKKDVTNLPELISVYDFVSSLRADKKGDEKDLIRRINKHRLTWEMIPTEFLNKKEVYEALLEHMPITAMTRNLGKMTSIGMLDHNFNSNVAHIEKSLKIAAEKNKLPHPFQLFLAWKTYSSGRGVKGNLSWSPNAKVLECLEDAFYKAFVGVTPMNKRIVIGLDVSGSMGSPMNGTNVTCRDATVALSLIAMKTEAYCQALAFSDTLTQLRFNKNSNFNSALNEVSKLSFTSTDCSLPVLAAGAQNVPVDLFIILTDNETWFGGIHPFKALQKYRKQLGVNAKMAVCALTSTGFSIADPSDPGMMDFVGFDANMYSAISEFASL